VRKEKRFVENNIDQSDDERTRNNKDRSNGADADGVVFCSPLYLAHFVDRLGNVFFYNIHVKNESPMHFSKKTEKKQEKNGSRNIPEEMKEAGGYVCHETIYAYIYDEENRKEQHWKLLMRHRPKRIKQGTRKSRKGGTIKNMVSISKRPESVETRKEAGHWESDSMIFSKQKEILSVQTERKTRAVRITKCKDKTAEETKEAVTGSLGGEIETFLKSITFDRGTEGAEHEKMSEYLNADIYFCHPYCSWEKGSVENRNMFIRRYFPRHTNMSEVTDEMIYEVQEKLNNRPMKCLKYRTPNEMIFHERFGRFPPVGKKILMPEKVPRKKISESGLINA
jgi:IS30 family transposase